MKKILIIAPAYDMHTYRFISNLKKEDDFLKIDVLSYQEETVSPDCSKYCENIFFPINKAFPYKIGKIRYLSIIEKSLNLRRSLLEIYKNKGEYDAIIILWVYVFNFLSIDVLKKISKNIVLVPLGSDILRVSSHVLFLLKPLYKLANYIVLSPIDFKNHVQKYFKIPEHKIISLDFGSTIIDMLNSNEISVTDAKRELCLDNKFVITIGYNAKIEQNHIEVIKQIEKVSDNIPQNSILLFPMTYPSGAEAQKYIADVKSYLDRTNFKYIIFSDYIDDKAIVKLRKASDIFIHAQTTDAGCATLQEYLIAGSTVVNANWLQYSELEKYGAPYFSFSSLNNLGNVLLDAINNPNKYKVSDKLKEKIIEKGWKFQIRQWIAFLNNI